MFCAGENFVARFRWHVRLSVRVGLHDIHTPAVFVVDPPLPVTPVEIYVRTVLLFIPWSFLVRQSIPHIICIPSHLVARGGKTTRYHLRILLPVLAIQLHTPGSFYDNMCTARRCPRHKIIQNAQTHKEKKVTVVFGWHAISLSTSVYHFKIQSNVQGYSSPSSLRHNMTW